MDELIREHLDYLRMKGRRPNSVIYRRRALERMTAALAPVPLADATEADLIGWRASLAGLSDASVIAYVANARGYYKYLQRTGYRPDNPAADLPVPPSPAYEPRPISDADLFAAIQAATGRVRLMLVLIGCCGMRPIEIACLRRNCVRDSDPQPGIRIARDATKGARRGRFIPLPPGGFVLAELAAYGMPSSGWMFPRLDGKPGHVEAHLVSHLLCNHLHSEGYGDTAYAGRHRFGTELLDAAGGNIRVVQVTMGHEKLSTTAVYTKVRNAESAAAVAKLPVPVPAPKRRRGRALPAAAVTIAMLSGGAVPVIAHPQHRPAAVARVPAPRRLRAAS